MPRRRIKPRKDHQITERPNLSADQQSTLCACGLSGGVLRAVEHLARDILLHEQMNCLNNTEIKAALVRLLRKTANFRAEFDNSSRSITVHIDLEHMNLLNLKEGFIFIVADLCANLRAIEHAIERHLAKLRGEKFSGERFEFNNFKAKDSAYTGPYLPVEPAIMLRRIFQEFKIPFNRSKKSPAVSTTYALMNMIRPTSMSVADDRVRKAMNNDEYSGSGALAVRWLQESL
jgi:hypothetical protein